ncbi:MAG: flagellar M-ring protein FliF [Mesorhizobium amorphae]|nr:MAG: flagellar M-ring protein FliF [Mesorhizobium amorphae]
MPQQLQSILANLASFGTKRLLIMGAVAALVIGVVAGGAVFLNKPAFETLYVGLERSDVNQIGMVLGEAGIAFDVGSDGTTVLVPAGLTAKARMMLAEKGLPTSANAGYELFDNVGSLGLTSFMQQVTRVRALEGEIARTLQSLNGIKAARVHLVMSERASFRRDEQQPTASVVIRTAGIDARTSAAAIRYLVAAAVPGLDAEKVTVLDASGQLLAAGEDPSGTSAARSLGVEQTVEAQVESNIRRALMPYLGPENFRASVKAEVNTDTRQTEETIFDPESRVERSTQVVKSAENSSQRQASAPTSVEENLPDEGTAPSDGPQSSENNERKEETTNYEMNTKRIATTSNGYSVTKMSVAVVVNRERLKTLVGGEAMDPAQLEARIAEIRTLAMMAAGLDEKRGDAITVSAVEFIDGLDGVEVVEPGVMDTLGEQAGTFINAGAFIVVALLLGFFGLRPLAAALRPQAPATEGETRSFEDVQRALPTPDGTSPALLAANEAGMPALATPTALDDLRQKIKPAPAERLARMVELNEERTAQILRKWAGREEAA